MLCIGVASMRMFYINIIGFLLLSHALLSCLSTKLDYDFSIHAAQQGNWKKAQKLLNPLLVDHYNQADMLYDSGVISYQNNDLKIAKSYFSHAAETGQVSDALREKAYFNAGNTLVALDELESAVKQYEKTLSINAGNIFAQYNLDKVKEMLEQKQKEKEKKQKKEQDNQQAEKKDQENTSQENKNEEKSFGEQEKNNQSDDSQLDKENSQKKPTEKIQKDGQKQSSLSDNTSPNNNLSQNSDNKDKQSKQAERSTNGENREQKRGQHNRDNQCNDPNNEDQGYSNNKTNDQFKYQPHNKQYNKIENHNFTSTQQDISTSSPDTHSQNKHQEHN